MAVQQGSRPDGIIADRITGPVPAPADDVPVVEACEEVDMLGQKTDRIDEIADFGLGHDPVQADPAPAGACADLAGQDPGPDLPGRVIVNAQQMVAVRAGAGAPRTRLDAEQVIEQKRHQAGLDQLAGRIAQVEGDDTEPAGG